MRCLQLLPPNVGLAAAGLACLLSFTLSVAQAADAPNAEEATDHSANELVRRLAEQLAIDSIDCEYQIEFIEKGARAKTTKRKHCFARSGQKWLSTEELENGARELRVLFDGDTTFSYRMLLSPAGEQLDDGTVQLDAPREFPLLTPEAFLGTDLSNIRRSLVSVLRLAEVELSRENLDDGTRAYRMVAREVGANRQYEPKDETKTKVRFQVEALLDPKHAMLPREILITEDANSMTSPGWKQHVKVLDYREVIDEKPNKVRWFPFVAVLEQPDPAPDIRFTVSRLRINPELAASTFELTIPDGTSWLDTRVHGPGTPIPIKGQRAP